MVCFVLGSLDIRYVPFYHSGSWLIHKVHPRAMTSVRSGQMFFIDQTAHPPSCCWQLTAVPSWDAWEVLAPVRAPTAKVWLQLSYKSSVPLPRGRNTLGSQWLWNFLWNQVGAGLQWKGHLWLLSLPYPAFIFSWVSFNLSFAQKRPSQSLLVKNPIEGNNGESFNCAKAWVLITCSVKLNKLFNWWPSPANHKHPFPYIVLRFCSFSPLPVTLMKC